MPAQSSSERVRPAAGKQDTRPSLSSESLPVRLAYLSAAPSDLCSTAKSPAQAARLPWVLSRSPPGTHRNLLSSGPMQQMLLIQRNGNVLIPSQDWLFRSVEVVHVDSHGGHGCHGVHGRHGVYSSHCRRGSHGAHASHWARRIRSGGAGPV
jgi:hypothetical protein